VRQALGSDPIQNELFAEESINSESFADDSELAKEIAAAQVL
jgi:hypothetical protein